MPDVKSIDQEEADRAADRFARSHKLSLRDPLVTQLRNGLKMSFGYRRWRNEIKAKKEREQPSLFPAEVIADVLIFKQPEPPKEKP